MRSNFGKGRGLPVVDSTGKPFMDLSRTGPRTESAYEIG